MGALLTEGYEGIDQVGSHPRNPAPSTSRCNHPPFTDAERLGILTDQTQTREAKVNADQTQTREAKANADQTQTRETKANADQTQTRETSEADCQCTNWYRPQKKGWQGADLFSSGSNIANFHTN